MTTPALSEPPVCEACGDEYIIDMGEETTPLCDGCAHAYVDEARAAFAKVRAWLDMFSDQISEHAYQELASAISDVAPPRVGKDGG